MNAATERKRTTVRGLYETVTAYIDDNKRCNDVAERWLCSVLEPRLATISGIMNNRPRPDDLPAIEEFRVAEIQEQIKAKQSDIRALEATLRDSQRRGVKVA